MSRLHLRCGRILFAVAFLSLCASCRQFGLRALKPQRVFHVALDGDDADPGTAEAPFLTLEAARAAAREWRRQHAGLKGSVVIELHEGVHGRTKAFALTKEDSGTNGAPLVVRAASGERVTLSGGPALPSSAWGPVTNAAVRVRLSETARDKVRQIRLKDVGVTDLGVMRSRGFGRGGHAALELFFDGRPMTLARYPNEGWLRTTGAPKGEKGGQFTVADTRPLGWATNDHVWVHGYWKQDWADSYERVASMVGSNATVTVTTHPPHGCYGYHKGKRFYFLSVLEELDQPGEWYLDRAAGMLYFWSPCSLDSTEAIVSVSTSLIEAKDCRHVTVEGLILEACRGTAVQVTGGDDVVVRRCVIRNTGSRAVAISGATRSGVELCEVYETADGGISLSGGDRKTLTPAGLFARGNDIHHFSRWCRTYRAAVQVSGVGNHVAHNHIHHAPHMGIGFSGNDHVIEFNEIHDVCRETDDVGAIYCGRDWTMRGHVIRHNFFHHIQGPLNHCGAMSVYLDDTFCGVEIYGNVFHKASRAAFIGGGRDNTVVNNVFVDCQPSVHIDARAMGWAHKRGCINPDASGSWGMEGRLARVPYKKPVYAEKYPHLANILEDDPVRPKYNRVEHNISIGGKWLNLSKEAEGYNTITNNLVLTNDIGLLTMEDDRLIDMDQRRACRALSGYVAIPFERIGPRGAR